MLATQYARVAALERTLDQAAGSEPELAEEQRQTQARLHTSWHDGLVLVLGQEPDAAWSTASGRSGARRSTSSWSS